MLHRISLLSFTAAIAVTICISQVAVGQGGPRAGTYEGRPAIVVANDKLEFSVTPFGAWLASVALSDDSEKLNPLWNPTRFDRELGQPTLRNWVFGGHFACVDGFGAVRRKSRPRIPYHGEAHQTEMHAESGKGHVA